MPNTEVKLLNVDDTWWVTAWEEVEEVAGTHGPVVKRLRHRPFTAVTRVRFPHGSPTF